MIHARFVRCLVKCCVVKNAEWDITVCCLQTTPATSILEVTSLYLIRMTIRLFSGQLPIVLQHANRDVAVGFRQACSSAASGPPEVVVLFIRLQMRCCGGSWHSGLAPSIKPETFPSERRFLTPSHSDAPVPPFSDPACSENLSD